jgi:hypothetical protein
MSLLADLIFNTAKKKEVYFVTKLFMLILGSGTASVC